MSESVTGMSISFVLAYIARMPLTPGPNVAKKTAQDAENISKAFEIIFEGIYKTTQKHR